MNHLKLGALALVLCGVHGLAAAEYCTGGRKPGKPGTVDYVGACFNNDWKARDKKAEEWLRSGYKEIIRCQLSHPPKGTYSDGVGGLCQKDGKQWSARKDW
jgi:hypothetical protein